ncbi:Methylmalonic aciduria and homocystinuria type D protein, mitochondrial [Amphibalanus amphitrite]|uniref:Methylmalonic aciduria and homocystinuria type D protein, mitochondrial n=1 Tax=Amphibalanus amphitrite TaxID=1232801 RepID=A0A6A4X0T8_AMPAM|nr:Methylmalonic aciduria and homocystinuria type D protein, mitochondrial [Amphibalanus amphitrite]
MPGDPVQSEATPAQPVLLEIQAHDCPQLLKEVLLEIQAHDCPQLLKEEFRPLFRERDIAAGRLTVLVVSQRTDQDMATWSEQVEQERLELASQFVSVGRDIVLGLRRRGFWADLVDPTTGRPHLGELAPAADADDRLIETDDRLGRLGFEIDDLGCCKVIRHAVWGSHVFIGCLFTDAPLDDPRLSDDSRYIPIPGYQLFRRDRPGCGGRPAGGVAVAVRDGLRATEVAVSERPVPGSKLESLWLRVSAGNQQIYFCSVYRPPRPTTDDVTADLDDLQEQLETVSTRHGGLIFIAGDVNIDMASDSTAKRRYCQLMDAFALRQHITGPTFRSSGSTIDVICSNGTLQRQGTLHCDYSDHNWARATFSLTGLRPKPTVVTARSWRRTNAEELNRRLQTIDWSPVFHSTDPAQQWEYFLGVTRPVLDELAPLKRTKVRNPTAPPVTEATKQLMAERRAALRDGDRDHYRQLNRRVQAAIRRDTRDAVQRHIQERGRASLWRGVQPS